MTAGRIFCLHLAACATMLVTLAGAADLPLKLVYNASASAPLGWYAVEPATDVAPGDLVIVRPPMSVEPMMVARGYIGDGVPLVKFVRAVAGARVCRDGDHVTIDATAVGAALDRDSRGRPLPHWNGCRVLGPTEVFLLNGDVRNSFDGRYFGPTRTADILGRARPLWTW
jgi:conjugative transfer signal peptidase TraF